MPADPQRVAPDVERLLDLLEPANFKRDIREGIGGLLVARAQKAFVDKEWDGEKWPDKYPGMEPPFINKAAALNDLLNRDKVLEDTLDQGNPLQLKGTMLKSVSDRSFYSARSVTGAVEVQVGWGSGPAKEYAAVHMLGGTTKQRITQSARDKLKKQKEASGTSPDMKKALTERMGFVNSQDELVTQVNKRPALGITKQIGEDIQRWIQDYFSGKWRPVA
jgi:phage gpG-like protein